MRGTSFFDNGILQGLISLILVISLVAGLCLPGLRMETAEPKDPLDAQEVLDITTLEVSENISSLTPIVVPTGGSAQPTEPQEEEDSEESNTEQGENGEETEATDGTGNGDQEGNEEGLQGAEGGELVPDLAVVLTWKENRTETRSLSCQPSGTAYADVLNNRLSGGTLDYEISLAGENAADAMIEQVSWQADSGTGVLNQGGTLYMQGGTYKITVSVVVSGQRVPFCFELNHITDVTLKMEYVVREDGRSVTREAICENTGSKTLEDIYTDQLTDGMLEYAFFIVGVEGGVEITSVSCYQSGSGNTKNGLAAEDEIQLLLNNGTTGENTFTVRAQHEDGTTYRFTFSVPFKPRGAEIIQIETHDLENGQTITTGSSLNFRLSAYRPEDSGNVYIPAEGTDTVFSVSWNGLPVEPDSSNGRVHDFIVVPPNPVVGDSSEHILYVYAEDSYGNWGEKTLVLNGQRAQEGQIIGTANIYVDMTVLGLGIVGPVTYDVLSNEPVSYVVLKAIMGEDMGEIYGSARENFGWRGRYDGNPDPNRGFYLKNLYTGYSATAFDNSAWPRCEDNSIDLDAIDAYFGSDIDMATLWRCLARNGLSKSGPDPDGGFGQFDYTGSSGWMYTVNGIFPTEGMDKYSLKDGDTLTLLYTLAGGWDVGGAGSRETNQVGYCIQAMDGRLVTEHIWEDNQCVCCGRILSCLHENRAYVNLGNGQHVEHCNDCDEDIGSPAYHTWKPIEGDLVNHTCEVCEAMDAHFWQEKQIIKEPTCTDAGEVLYSCDECLMEKTETPTTGHEYGNAWEHDSNGHFKKCQNCGEEGEMIPFQFYWDEGEEDYICQCNNCTDILHDWTIHQWGGFAGEIDESRSNCQLEVQYCYDCGNYLYKPGKYPDRHSFISGSCSVCGEPDPNYHEHVWSEWGTVTDPDCVNPGLQQRECSAENCDDPVQTQEIPALGHTWGDWYEISPATCTEDGIQGHACSVCGAEETKASQSAYGHEWTETGYESESCTQDGYRYWTCNICGETSTDVIYAYGHSFADGYCSNCGEYDPDYVEENYSEEYSMFTWSRRRWYSGNNGEERI